MESEFSKVCPMCGNEDMGAWVGGDHDYVFGTCLECGYQYKTVAEQLTLDEVNELRIEDGMEPLAGLRPQESTESGTEP